MDFFFSRLASANIPQKNFSHKSFIVEKSLELIRTTSSKEDICHKNGSPRSILTGQNFLNFSLKPMAIESNPVNFVCNCYINTARKYPKKCKLEKINKLFASEANKNQCYLGFFMNN